MIREISWSPNPAVDAAAPFIVGTPVCVVDAPSPQVRGQFSEDVAQSLVPEDLSITNLGSSADVIPTSVVFDQSTNTAGFSLPTSLFDGNDGLTIFPADVTDGVGYGRSSEIGIASTGGFAINPGDTLIRHTLDGDADLNGNVDIADFSRIAASFDAAGKVWTTGDSTYDNVTDIVDFAGLAANFNQSATGITARYRPFSQRVLDALEHP